MEDGVAPEGEEGPGEREGGKGSVESRAIAGARSMGVEVGAPLLHGMSSLLRVGDPTWTVGGAG